MARQTIIARAAYTLRRYFFVKQPEVEPLAQAQRAAAGAVEASRRSVAAGVALRDELVQLDALIRRGATQ